MQTSAARWLQAYREYNARAVELGRSRGHFLVDLCRPGHMTACLRTFQETIHCNDDNWDAHFGAPLDGRPSARLADAVLGGMKSVATRTTSDGGVVCNTGAEAGLQCRTGPTHAVRAEGTGRI